MTSDTVLSLWLDEAAQELLTGDICLFDEHVEAPGYVLFRTSQPEIFQAYLAYRITAQSEPLIYGFSISAEIENQQQMKALIQAAQEDFLKEIDRLRKAAKPDMIPIQGTESKPVFWVGTLGHFGKTPYGDNLYRIVLASTRTWLVGGRWTKVVNGVGVGSVVEYRWVPRYGDNEGWVLEKWLSATEYAGTRVQWDAAMLDPETGLYELGPYPERGEFESCHLWTNYPSTGEVETRIQLMEKGHREFNLRRNMEAHREAIEARKRASGDQLEDMLLDALPAFPGRAMSGAHYRSSPERLEIKATPETSFSQAARYVESLDYLKKKRN